MLMEIRVRKAPGMWVVRSEDAVLAETSEALELDQDGANPVIYFPQNDVAMAFLDRTGPSEMPMGRATSYALVTPAATVQDAAWSFDAPAAPIERLAGYIAFHPAKVTVERL